MGTNYYLKENVSACNLFGEKQNRHIGKSSGGWCFSLHVYPEDKIHTLDDWKTLLESTKYRIEDEYGRVISYAEALDIITNRSGNIDPDEIFQPQCQRSELLYRNWDDFHNINHSSFGPNGLLRFKVDKVHCIGHGEGTYDYIVGEFS